MHHPILMTHLQAQARLINKNNIGSNIGTKKTYEAHLDAETYIWKVKVKEATIILNAWKSQVIGATGI